MYIYINVHVHCIHLYMYTYIYICTRTYTYTYTYTYIPHECAENVGLPPSSLLYPRTRIPAAPVKITKVSPNHFLCNRGGGGTREVRVELLFRLFLTHSLQHTATHCITLQHSATYCSTLQHTAAQYNTLQTPTIHQQHTRDTL